jgi:hypothetical protein
MENPYITVEGLTKGEVRKKFNEAFIILYSKYRFNIDKTIKEKEEAEKNLEESNQLLIKTKDERNELNTELEKAKNINI